MGKKGFMTTKVDMEKAYDRLSWNFIHETLMKLSLPLDLVRLIIECLTSKCMNILWNGELTNDFLLAEVYDRVIICLLIFLCFVSRD